MSVIDDLQYLAFSEAKKAGIKVHLKTDVSPEKVIYDSDTPSDGGEGLLKYSIRITTRDGSRIAEYGEPPEINYFKVFVIGGIMVASLFITLKGIKGSYEQIKN